MNMNNDMGIDFEQGVSWMEEDKKGKNRTTLIE